MNLIEINQPKVSWQEWIKNEATTQIEDVLLHFFLSLRTENTRISYSRDLRNFFNFLKSLNITITEIDQITEKMVLLWREDLKKKQKAANSRISRMLCALSSLLEFALKRKLIPINPAKLVFRPKVKKEGKTNVLNGEEVKLLLETAKKRMEDQNQTERSHKAYATSYVILSTLLSVGMRVSELCNLKISDFDEKENRLHMKAKGDEEHSPVIHEKTIQLLREYINIYRPNASKEDYIFTRAQETKRKTRLTRNAVNKMLIKIISESEMDKHVTPHSMRATLATLLHKNGVPIGEIQELLNHKQITTTSLYIKKVNEMEQAAARKIDILI